MSFDDKEGLSMLYHDFFFTATSADHDFSVFFEPADNVDDALLHLFNVFEANGAHVLHVFLYHFPGTGRHIAEELALELFGCAFAVCLQEPSLKIRQPFDGFLRSI